MWTVIKRPQVSSLDKSVLINNTNVGVHSILWGAVCVCVHSIPALKLLSLPSCDALSVSTCSLIVGFLPLCRSPFFTDVWLGAGLVSDFVVVLLVALAPVLLVALAPVLYPIHLVNCWWRLTLTWFTYLFPQYKTISGPQKRHIFYFYKPPTKLREGNVFTDVCHSVHWGRGDVPWY